MLSIYIYDAIWYEIILSFVVFNGFSLSSPTWPCGLGQHGVGHGGATFLYFNNSTDFQPMFFSMMTFINYFSIIIYIYIHSRKKKVINEVRFGMELPVLRQCEQIFSCLVFPPDNGKPSSPKWNASQTIHAQCRLKFKLQAAPHKQIDFAFLLYIIFHRPSMEQSSLTQNESITLAWTKLFAEQLWALQPAKGSRPWGMAPLTKESLLQKIHVVSPKTKANNVSIIYCRKCSKICNAATPHSDIPFWPCIVSCVGKITFFSHVRFTNLMPAPQPSRLALSASQSAPKGLLRRSAIFKSNYDMKNLNKWLVFLLTLWSCWWQDSNTTLVPMSHSSKASCNSTSSSEISGFSSSSWSSTTKSAASPGWTSWNEWQTAWKLWVERFSWKLQCCSLGLVCSIWDLLSEICWKGPVVLCLLVAVCSKSILLSSHSTLKNNCEQMASTWPHLKRVYSKF